MKIEKTIYSLCLVTFSDDELFGEKSFQMYNKELQSLNFPHIINVFFSEDVIFCLMLGCMV